MLDTVNYDRDKTWTAYMNYSNRNESFKPITSQSELDYTQISGEYVGWVGRFEFDGDKIWADDLSQNYFLYKNRIYHKNGTLNKILNDVVFLEESSTLISPTETKYGIVVSRTNDTNLKCTCQTGVYCNDRISINCGNPVNCTQLTVSFNISRNLRCDRDYKTIPRLMIISEKKHIITMKEVDDYLNHVLKINISLAEKASKFILSNVDNYLTYFNNSGEMNATGSIKFIKTIKHVMNLTLISKSSVNFEFTNFKTKLTKLKNQSQSEFQINEIYFRIEFPSDDQNHINNKISIIYWKNKAFFKVINKNQILKSNPLDITLHNNTIIDFEAKFIFLDHNDFLTSCAYLDMSDKTWKHDGCNSRLGGYGITCECDHLANFVVLSEPFKNVINITWIDYVDMSNRYEKYKPITNQKELKKLYKYYQYKYVGWLGNFSFGGKNTWPDDLSQNYFLYKNRIYYKNGTLKTIIVNSTFYEGKSNLISPTKIKDGILIQKHHSNSNVCTCYTSPYCSKNKYFNCGEILNCTQEEVSFDLVRQLSCEYDYKGIPRLMIIAERKEANNMEKVNDFLDSVMDQNITLTENQTKNIFSTVNNYLTFFRESKKMDSNIIIKFIQTLKHVFKLTAIQHNSLYFNFTNFQANLAEFKNQNINSFQLKDSSFHVQFQSDDQTPISSKISVIQWKHSEFLKIMNIKQKIISVPLEISVYNETIHNFFVKIYFEGEFNQTALCSYLDLSNKMWNTGGCIKTLNSTGMLCQCNHLTNFAVLFNPEIKPSRWMSIFTHIGLGFSMFGEVATIIYSLFYPRNNRKRRKSHSVKIFLNLSISMLIMNALFTFGIDKGNKNCASIGFFLHYFFLACFAWMTVQGIFAFYLLIRVFSNFPGRFDLISFCLAWGIPLIPPTIISGIDWKFYVQDKICWLDGVPLYLGVYFPILFCLMVNISIFIGIIWNLEKQNRTRSLSYTGTPKKKREYFMTFTLIFLFGLTWTFGFLMKLTTSPFVQFLFVLLNAFQGLYIFICRVLSN